MILEEKMLDREFNPIWKQVKKKLRKRHLGKKTRTSQKKQNAV